ncbi:hypothetical protein M1271_02490 [Patescibacteria group bacterium]|nr:hypothetical protein [Patescibacteria group bacterium]MCL5797643.1 hypothetical protein [Patescibacteria group bacterium]
MALGVNLYTLLYFSLGLNIFLVLYFLMRLLSGGNISSATEKTQHDSSEIVTKTKTESADILSKAIRQANKILVNSELKGLRIVAKEKLDSKKIADEYQEHIKSLEQKLEKQYAQQLEDTQEGYNIFLSTVEKSLQERIDQNQKMLEARALAFIDHSERLMEQFTESMQNQVREKVEKELQQAKAEIETYKQRRMQILDENIIEILEKTLHVALGKKLSLADQSDLIYQALEDAKKEHALD